MGRGLWYSSTQSSGRFDTGIVTGAFAAAVECADVLLYEQAIMGAVAVLNGIQRSTVSVTIIIVEGTGRVVWATAGQAFICCWVCR